LHSLRKTLRAFALKKLLNAKDAEKIQRKVRQEEHYYDLVYSFLGSFLHATKNNSRNALDQRTNARNESLLKTAIMRMHGVKFGINHKFV
jgi:hypothetical protein